MSDIRDAFDGDDVSKKNIALRKAHDEIERLRAENARLREALEWVVDSDPSVMRTADFHVDCKCHRCAMDNARAALAEKGETK